MPSNAERIAVVQERQSIEHFRELIADHGGQEQLVSTLAKMGIRKSRSTVAGWMNAKRHTYPDAATLVRIANRFEVSVDWLLGRTENRKPLTVDDRASLVRQIETLRAPWLEAAASVLRQCIEALRSGRPLPTAVKAARIAEADRVKRLENEDNAKTAARKSV